MNTTDGDLVRLQDLAIVRDAWLANPPKEATETQIDAVHEWLEGLETDLETMVTTAECLESSCPAI